MLTRDVAAAARETWDVLTDPDKTAQWFGRWTGAGRVGEPIQVAMTHEEGESAMEMTVTECEAPRKLRLVSRETASWDISVELTEQPDGTKILFTHHDVPLDQLHEIGPGWEFYLDRFAGSVDKRPAREWEAYFPAQQEYYRALTAGN